MNKQINIRVLITKIFFRWGQITYNHKSCSHL